MNSNQSFIDSLAIAGYRSFGAKIQKLSILKKINLLIGPNNCGKSNVLKLIHDIYPKLTNQSVLSLTPFDRHIPGPAEFKIGKKLSLALNENKTENKAFNDAILPRLRQEYRQTSAPGHALRVLKRKAELDGTSDDVWFYFASNKQLFLDNWKEAFALLSDREIIHLWQGLTGSTGGARQEHWYPGSLQRLVPDWASVSVVTIPAIRRVGQKGSISDDFGGEGLIERLAKLQNPAAFSQEDRRRFDKINKFLKAVTSNDSAQIEIPHERDTIVVHMDGKSLPLDSLGTGIHEVIILAAVATVFEDTVVCMEEPELHLNPILQKKLVRYLLHSTTNQYFITTHSAALMDTPEADIYHVQLDNGESVVERVTSDKHRSAICEDLGYHPSDLLQANCIIWVEGPSDRIYINYWLHSVAPGYVEGTHYSIMFYGGRLAAHLSGNEQEDSDASAVNDFISLRRINRRPVIVMDSDRDSENASINSTKQRLVEEFDQGPGYAWITDGREIENYIPIDQVKLAIEKTHPQAKPRAKFGPYENTLRLSGKDGKQKLASKVAIAKYVVDNFEMNREHLSIGEHINKLSNFISDSNIKL